MRKRVIIAVACMLMIFMTTSVLAGSKEQAKAEFDNVKEVYSYLKSTLAPLINCYAGNQPKLQFLKMDYPDRGKEAVTAMDFCSTKYTKELENEPKATNIKRKAINFLEKDSKLGSQYITELKKYTELQVKFNKSGKDADKLALDSQKMPVEKAKQELFKNANEFKLLVEEFNAYKNEVLDRYKKAQAAYSKAR